MNYNKNLKSVQPNEFYPSILESIAEGIVVLGMDRKVVFINKMAKELIGLHGELAEGVDCNEIMKTDLCSKGCPLDLTSNNDNNCSHASHFMNINLYKKDNSSIPVCLNVAPLKDAGGNMVGFIENFRPMSEVIKVIEALEKSNIVLAQEKSKIDSIIDSLADGVFTVDKELRISSFNNGMENLTGLKSSDVTGLTCREVLNADNCRGDCPLAYTLKNGYGAANVRERIEGKNGKTIPVVISTAFLKDGTLDKGLIVTIRDVSEIEILKKEINSRYHFSNIIGKSNQMQQIFELIESLSDTDCAILIEGESGTGKELVARAVHHENYRKNKPFIKVNCSAIVEGLFESELFGHVKGAFSGAIRDKIGKFEYADGGTIFLDEIGDMPLALQPKLLRVLQDKEFERVGDNKTRKVDVAIIAATNMNLKNRIKINKFREDLYYRLCVVPIETPPLRERKEDIPVLINHFLEKCYMKIPNRPRIIEVTPEALAALMDYNWIGNIRELENAIEHAYIRSKTNRIDLESLPPSITGVSAQYNEVPPLRADWLPHSITGASVKEGSANEIKSESREEMERLFLERLLEKYNGNKTKAAKDFGCSRTTFWRKFKKHHLTA